VFPKNTPTKNLKKYLVFPKNTPTKNLKKYLVFLKDTTKQLQVVWVHVVLRMLGQQTCLQWARGLLVEGAG